MSTFVAGSDLSEKVRELLSGTNVRCAVAFWGDGAANLLEECSPNNLQNAKIVCDVSMGGTFPPELKKLGAPKNDKLRHVERLHAKVYLSDAGAVVASANFSSNGIGFSEKGQAKLIEAGTFYSYEDTAWRDISLWFDRLYEEAKQVDVDALARAYRGWSPPLGSAGNPNADQPVSLLNLVRSNPQALGQIGFVFVSSSNSARDVERARKAAALSHGNKAEEFPQWPAGDMFLNWDKSDVSRWPATFFEFWMPGNKLSILARQVAYLAPEDGTVFARPASSAVKAMVTQKLLSTTEMAKLDGATAKTLIERNRGARLYANASELWKVLVELDSK